MVIARGSHGYRCETRPRLKTTGYGASRLEPVLLTRGAARLLAGVPRVYQDMQRLLNLHDTRDGEVNTRFHLPPGTH